MKNLYWIFPLISWLSYIVVGMIFNRINRKRYKGTQKFPLWVEDLVVVFYPFLMSYCHVRDFLGSIREKYRTWKANRIIKKMLS